MSDASRQAALNGIRLYLRRTKTKAQLETLAASLMSEDATELDTVLTNVGFGASQASALARAIDRFQVLNLVEAIIAEMTALGVTAALGAEEGVNVVSRADFSFSEARN